MSVPVTTGSMLEAMREEARWRVAVTHDDIDRSVHAALERAGFVAVSCPVMTESSSELHACTSTALESDVTTAATKKVRRTCIGNLPEGKSYARRNGRGP